MGRIARWLAVAALVAAPTQVGVAVSGANVTLADILLAAAFGFSLFSWRTIRVRAENVVFVALACISALLAADKAGGIRESAQMALYFVAGGAVFSALADDEQWRGIARVAFLACGAVVVAVAIAQYFMPEPDRFPFVLRDGLSVRGTFGNNNVLCGYLCLLAPMAFAEALDAKRGRAARIGCGALAACSVVVALSGGAVIALAIALFALALRRSRLCAAGVALALTAFFVFAAPHLPHDNLYCALDSTMPYRMEAGSARYADDGVHEWRAGESARRYPEWQAAIAMSLERPFVGIGPGAYQKNVGQFFDVVPRATGPSEPDTQNLYLVIASTMGWPALFALLAMLIGSRAVNGAARNCGADAAIAAFAIAAIFHPLLVRGIGIPLVFVLEARERGIRA